MKRKPRTPRLRSRSLTEWVGSVHDGASAHGDRTTRGAWLTDPRTGKSTDGASLDPSQEARVRAQLLEETMTSPEWRGWLVHAASDMPAAVAKLRERVKTAGMPCEAEWLKE